MKSTTIRILYLDDNEQDRLQVRDILQQEPGAFELTETGSSGEFDALLRSKTFDLILCDVNVPGLSGLEVLEKVKALNTQLPVIIFTGSQNGQLGVESIQLGAADLIIKSPASLSILSHKIRIVMDKIQADEKFLKSERRYNAMISRTPVGVYIYRKKPDSEGKFEYISPRCCEILGLKEEEVLANADHFNKAAHPEDRESFNRARKDAKAAGLSFFWEGRFIVGGELRWVRIESEPMFLPDGDSFWNGVVVDITGRKRMEDQILQNEAIFTSFLENSPVYVFFKDRDIRTLRLSSNYEQMLGIPVSQALGKTMDELFPSELSKSMVADDLRILNEGKRVNVVEDLNGRIYETTKFPIFRDGKPEMLAGFTLDITERMQAERLLHHSEAFNQALISESPIGIAVFNNKGAPLSGNAAWKKIWGFSEEKYQQELQRRFENLEFDKWDAYLQGYHDQVCQVYEKGGSLYLPDLKIPVNHPGGAEWVSQYYYAILDEHGQVERMVTLTEDISARKKAEAEIIKSHALLERIQAVAQLGSVEIDLTAQTVVASAEAQRIYGWQNDVLSLSDVQASALPEYRAEIDANLERLIHLRQEFNIQYKIKRRSDGAIRDIHSIAEFNPEENTVIGSIQDITERKLIMQVLMDNEEKFRTLFENAQDMIFLSDVNDRILDVNKRACELTGYSRDELLKMKITDLQAQEIRGQAGTLLKNDYKKYGNRVIENIGLCKNGSKFPVEITLSRINIARGIRFIAIVRDVSEHKRIEQDLKEQFDTLNRINDITVDRELRMVDLKKEINALLLKAGKKEKYHI